MSVSRQIAFHATEDEVVALVERCCRETRLVITERDSRTPGVYFAPLKTLSFSSRGAFTVTSAEIAETMSRKLVPNSEIGTYYRIEYSGRWFELEPPVTTVWKNAPALISGRIYLSGSVSNADSIALLFGRVARAMRRQFSYIRECLCYASPKALQSVIDGAWILGSYRPPEDHEEWGRIAAFVRERILQQYGRSGPRSWSSR